MAGKPFDAGEIQIEDPLDFLSASEKEAYMRAHQDTLRRSAEPVRRMRGTDVEMIDLDDAYDEEAYEDDEDDYDDGEAYDDEDDYAEEEEPPEKTYVYKDTRLHSDSRGSKKKPQKKTNGARRAEAREADGDDEVEETALDFMLSAGTKAMLAAIIVILAIIVYVIYIRPVFRRTLGLQGQQTVTLPAGGGAAQSAQSATAQETETPAQSTEEGNARPEAPATEGEQVVTTTQLNLRTAPDTQNSEVITTVPEGERLTRLSDDGAWSKVLYKGQELFCASQYLQPE